MDWRGQEGGRLTNGRGPSQRAQDCWARKKGGTEREEVAPSGGSLAVGCKEGGVRLSSEEME